MNRIFMATILAINLLSLTAKAQTVTRDDLKKTILHMQSLARELQGDLDAATAAKLALEGQLGGIQGKLADSQAKADALQADITAEAERHAKELSLALAGKLAAERERDAAEADLKHVLGKYHFLKLLGAGLLAALVFLLVWRYSPPVLGPWAIAIYTVPPAAAFAAFFAIL